MVHLTITLIILLAAIVVFIMFRKAPGFYKKFHKKYGWLLILSIGSFLILLTFGILRLYQIATVPDTQCTQTHKSSLIPPRLLKTDGDYLTLGDYHYETGHCTEAITDYTKAIELNPKYPEAYNNRAYTYMRLQQYAPALVDLNKALELRPNYVHALSNRGDLYNYYGPVINRKLAIVDYDKVIALGAATGTSVCGHKAMAETNNIIPLAFLRLFYSLNCR